MSNWAHIGLMIKFDYVLLTFVYLKSVCQVYSPTRKLFTWKKFKKALNAIRLFNRFFSTTELLQLITSNFFSVLYYNSEIWHLHSLKSNLKKMLLSASARAVKMCVKFKTDYLSFIWIHSMYNRATPEKFLLYKHALTLFKLINTNDYTME